jgi:roadblock/LC7 domain-containing protein
MQFSSSSTYSSSSRGSTLGMSIVLLINIAVLCAVGIAALIVAAKDGDNSCQGYDVTGLSLKDWLIGFGIAEIGHVVAIVVLGTVGVWVCGDGGAVLAVLTMLCYGFFTLAWWIVGIVITARSHDDCVHEKTSIGVMTIFALCCQGISLFCHSSQRRNE